VIFNEICASGGTIGEALVYGKRWRSPKNFQFVKNLDVFYVERFLQCRVWQPSFAVNFPGCEVFIYMF